MLLMLDIWPKGHSNKALEQCSLLEVPNVGSREELQGVYETS